MKLVSYHERICNLGDALQTISLEDFINKSNYDIKINGYVDRADMSKETNMIVNGWHRHPGHDFPTKSMFIGVHTDSNNIFRTNKFSLFGCRDLFTLNQCKSIHRKGILSYCSTVTFPYYQGDRCGELKLYHDNEDKTLYNLTFDEQKQRAGELLDILKTKELVYTDRLHIGLSCIALGTPVVITQRPFQKERYSMFHTVPQFIGFDKIITKESGVKEYMEQIFIDSFDKIYENFKTLKY